MPRCQPVDMFGFFVIPAEAGIQRSGVNSVRLDSGFRRNDENHQSLTINLWYNVRVEVNREPATVSRK